MKSDESIARDQAEITPILGAQSAEWYAEACRIEYDADERAILWACRCREVIRSAARDLGELADAAKALVEACSRLDEGGGTRVKDAVELVEKAMWWREAK